MGFISGFGGGILDGPGMNLHAARYDSRLMNWLHASFGIGSTLAPFLISLVLANQGTWRTGYWMIAQPGWRRSVGVLLPSPAPVGCRSELTAVQACQRTHAHASVRVTLSMPIVWIGIGVFILFAGLESGTGTWSKSIFFESLGIAEAIASNWVAFLLAQFHHRSNCLRLHRPLDTGSAAAALGMLGSTLGLALLVWNPFPESGLIALCVFGFVFGPIFAMLITATQEHGQCSCRQRDRLSSRRRVPSVWGYCPVCSASPR
ncbi:MAG: hypothetical protein U0670_22270 [Anaerolineae bacterium]